MIRPRYGKQDKMKLTLGYDSPFTIPGEAGMSLVAGGKDPGSMHIAITTEQAHAIVAHLAEQLGLCVSKQTTTTPRIDPSFVSDCPEGFETVIMFMARNGYDIDGSYGASEGRRMAAFAKRKGTVYVSVEAPAALQEDVSGMRIEYVRSYPTRYLVAGLGLREVTTNQKAA